jgi:hypothetical protein
MVLRMVESGGQVRIILTLRNAWSIRAGDTGSEIQSLFSLRFIFEVTGLSTS